MKLNEKRRRVEASLKLRLMGEETGEQIMNILGFLSSETNAEGGQKIRLSN